MERLSPRLALMILVALSASFNSVTGDAIVAVMPQMARELGTAGSSAFFVQMILVIPAVSIIVGSPSAGFLSRYFGLRRLMLLALSVYVVAGGFGCIAHSVLTLMLSRLLLGFVSGVLGTLSISCARSFDDGTRARLLGYSNAMSAAAAIGSYLIGGWLAHFFGWRAASLIYLWPALLLPIIFRGVPARDIPDREGAGLSLAHFPFRAVIPIYLLALLLNVIVFGPAVEGPFVLAARGMTDPSTIALVVSGPGILCMIVSSNYGWLSRLMPARAQYMFMFVFFFISAAVVSLSSGLPGAIVGLVLLGGGAGLLSPLLMVTLMKRVPPALVSTAAGILVSSTYMSFFLAPQIYKLIETYLRVTPYFGLTLISAACGIALMLRSLMSRLGLWSWRSSGI